MFFMTVKHKDNNEDGSDHEIQDQDDDDKDNGGLFEELDYKNEKGLAEYREA